MKKIFSLLMLSFALTWSFANDNSKTVSNQSSHKFPGDMYYILFNDGCYHLGVEVQDADGSIWWESVGYPGWCCNSTICMDQEEFSNLC